MNRLFGTPTSEREMVDVVGRDPLAVGAELVELADGAARGVRAVHLRSGVCDLRVLVDRGFDPVRAWVRGVPFGWISPTGVVNAALADTSPWGPLRTFAGGLMTTCGLEHALGPEEDDISHFNYPGRTSEVFVLHGRHSITPGRLVAYGTDWDRGVVYAEGEVRRGVVFGETLTLRRRVEVPIGGSEVAISDTVINDGYAPTPHAVLYHVNFGWPLVGEGGRVDVPNDREPDATDVDWSKTPTTGDFEGERFFQHHPAAGDDGWAQAGIRRVVDDVSLGAQVRWRSANLPHLFEWMVASRGHLVVALEPGNLDPRGRVAAREAGLVRTLDPGEHIDYELRLALTVEAATGP